MIQLSVVDSRLSASSLRQVVRSRSVAITPGPLSLGPADMPSEACRLRPAIGIGYRRPLDEWTRVNLARFDVLEITLDHCLTGSEATLSPRTIANYLP